MVAGGRHSHCGIHFVRPQGGRSANAPVSLRLAAGWYCARNPVALGRMKYHEQDSTVTYHSDKPTGPTAGSETVDALEFLARVVSHIANTYKASAVKGRTIRTRGWGGILGLGGFNFLS